MAATGDPGIELAARYATLLPRLPTYPEVPLLHESFGDRDYRYHIARGNGELIPKPLSISLHVPARLDNDEHYVEQLLREIELLAPLFDRDREVRLLRWTGTRLPDAQRSARVVESIRRHFHVTAEAEVNERIVFGSAPQSKAEFSSVLKSACNARPDSIELVDGTLECTGGPLAPSRDAAARLAMLEYAVSELAACGYVPAYKDRFDRGARHDVSLHGDEIGLGPGAVSQTGGGICQNLDNLLDWQASLDRRRLPVARGIAVAGADRRRAEVLRKFLCGVEVEAAVVEQCFPDVPGCLARLRSLGETGLVETTGEHVRASFRGRYLWRILAQCFDPDSSCTGRAATNGGPDVEGRQRGDLTQ